MVPNFVGKLTLLGIRIIGTCFAIQPRKFQIFWGNRLGDLLRFLKIRQKVVTQNLGLAFPDDPIKQKTINRESYRHLGNLTFEILMLLGFFRPMNRFILKWVDFSGLEHLTEARKKGLGVIFLSSHLGNWEVMAAAGGILGGFDVMLVTKRLKPTWLHQAMEKARAQCRVSAAYEPKTIRKVMSQLKKNGAVGFVLDQYSGAPVGVRVPLFGIPVGTSLAVSALVKRTGAVILPVENARKPDGRWTVRIHPPLEWKEFSPESSHFNLAANTAEYVRVLEKFILTHPSQWLWTHRRFKGDLSPLREGEWNEPRARR